MPPLTAEADDIHHALPWLQGADACGDRVACAIVVNGVVANV